MRGRGRHVPAEANRPDHHPVLDFGAASGKEKIANYAEEGQHDYMIAERRKRARERDLSKTDQQSLDQH